jgi:hypothetical protein
MLGEFRGHRIVDIRLFTFSAAGESIGTLKGFAIQPELLGADRDSETNARVAS